MDIRVRLDDVHPVNDFEHIQEVLRAVRGTINYAQVQSQEIVLLSDPHWRTIDIKMKTAEGERFSRHDALRILQSIPGYFGRWQSLDNLVYRFMEKGIVIFKQDGMLNSKEGTLKDVL